MHELFPFLKKNKIIFPIFHFIASFIWERFVFIYKDNMDFMWAIAKNNFISDQFELGMTYIISKLFCLVIILLLWKAIFYIFEVDKTADFYMLGVFFFVVLIAGIIMYPDLFGSMEMDNYTNYSMAIRFIPTYWQGVYTGTLYAGCLMTIPHPISIFIIQWFFFFSTVCYIYLNTKKLYSVGLFKYSPLIIFLLPESYFLTFNAYRNNFYTILLMFYIAYLFFHIKEKPIKDADLTSMIGFSFISAFLMVWRSEGLLVGLGGLVIYVIFLLGISRDKIKKICILLSVAFIAFIGIKSVQNIGSLKYYGKDYMILNTTPVLHNILNDPNANFAYTVAQEDLKNIESVVPVEVLKESGMSGYRDYNYTNGHLDFNQSLASDEAAKKYLKAYYSIIVHNPTTYLDVQINYFLSALDFDASHSLYAFEGEKQTHLDSFKYDQWSIGRNELMETWGTQKWYENSPRKIISGFIKGLLAIWREIVTNSGLNALLHAAAIGLNLIILVRELLNAFGNKVYDNIAFSIALFLVLAEFMAILLFMPDGRAAYLYPMLYASYLLLFLYIFNLRLNKEKKI